MFEKYAWNFNKDAEVWRLVSERCFGCQNGNFTQCAIFKMHQRLLIDVNVNEPDGVCPYFYAYAEWVKEKAVTE